MEKIKKTWQEEIKDCLKESLFEGIPVEKVIVRLEITLDKEKVAVIADEANKPQI
ncbi:MAG: hypothetical protein J5736_00225 [Bacilli bacterium]|nr:hypothetical protein [Bacilli bacterium]